MKIDLRKSALWCAEGALIGTGAILPGVSGGVLCAAFGIYEPLMQFLAHPVKNLKKSLPLLIPVLIGGGIGFVLLAKLVELLLGAFPLATMFLFCGLICGTVPQLAKDAVQVDAKRGWLGFAIALAVSFCLFGFLSGDITGSITPDFGWYVFCGAVWGLSMIVPGLSSSSVLLFVGLYEPMSAGIGNLDLGVLLPLGLGFLATIAACAKGVNLLMERFAPYFSKIILAFVLTSVLMILPIPNVASIENIPAVVDITFLPGIGFFVLGFALAAVMDAMKNKLTPNEAPTSASTEE